ncbi:MAG: hypothetical protein HZA08_06485 [Nitrospirae bacterium]|nr:hypothetical protein [Nitrospirota bacterium]
MKNRKAGIGGDLCLPFLYALFPLLLTAAALLFISCQGKASSQTWTVLVYMDGDNNLSKAALADISEMEAVGSTQNVNIILQLDLKGAITTKRYRIIKGSSELISDLGELDMAAPQTLTDFLIWAKDSYPADRTMLILWNHGNGWDQGDGPSVPLQKTVHSVLYDDDNHSAFLSNFKVRDAIKKSGLKIDILGFDASIMGTIEALYEFRELADIIITSQEVGQSNGWDYGSILLSLTVNPGMMPEDLAGKIVDAYRDFFENDFYPSDPAYEKRHSIAAHRTKYIELIAKQIDMAAVQLISMLDDPAPATRENTLQMIKNSRNNVQDIDWYVQPYVYVDLLDLSRLIGLETEIPELVSKATIAEYHGMDRRNANGISIVFFKMPDAMNLTYDHNYKNYDPETNTGNYGDFINQYKWDEFLKRYYAALGF